MKDLQIAQLLKQIGNTEKSKVELGKKTEGKSEVSRKLESQLRSYQSPLVKEEEIRGRTKSAMGVNFNDLAKSSSPLGSIENSNIMF